MKLKKIGALMLTGALAFSMLTACGGEETVEETKKETVAATAEETAKETAKETAEEAGDEADVLEVETYIANATGVDIHEIYMSIAGSDEWGENLLDEGTYLPSGRLLPIVLSIASEEGVTWDLEVVDGEGTAIDFYDIDISEMPTDGFAVELTIDEAGTATAKLAATVDELEGQYELAE